MLLDTPAPPPFNWEIVTALGTAALALMAFGSLIYAVLQWQDFRKESRIKHLMELVDQFEHNPMAEYRRKLAVARAPNGKLQTLDPNNPPPELHDVLNFFEHIGYLLDGGYLTLDGVSVEFHYWILHVWVDAKQFIKGEQSDNALYYRHLDKMVNRLLSNERDDTGKLPIPGVADIEDFYIEETRLPTPAPIPRQKRRRVPSAGINPAFLKP